VLGGMPRCVWGAIATGVAAAALAMTAAPAGATTDRVDYSDQANPICASANKQSKDLYEFTEAETDRLENLHTKNRKKALRALQRAEQLYDELPFKLLAIYQAELEQLKAIAPPPGYEETVARWLGVRGEIGALYQQYLVNEQQQHQLFEIRPKKPSRKALKRRHKRHEALEKIAVQIIVQLVNDSEVDLELGSKMGAAYCVTGADGEFDTIVFDDLTDGD
jgi:hypothetical protein